jgi:hypothetical protein
MHHAHGGASRTALSCRGAATYLQGRRKDAEMMNLFKALLDRSATPSVSERELAYLNASVSRVDLERREREVEAGLFRQPYPYF